MDRVCELRPLPSRVHGQMVGPGLQTDDFFRNPPGILFEITAKFIIFKNKKQRDR